IDTVPVWFSDATGEHVRVTVIVAANARLGDRLVVLSTPYGSSSATRDTSNTLTVIDPLLVFAPAGGDTRRVAQGKSSVVQGNEALAAARVMEIYGLNVRKLEALLMS